MTYRDYHFNTAIIYDGCTPTEMSVAVSGDDFHIYSGGKVTADNLQEKLKEKYDEIKIRIDKHLDK